MRQGDGVEHSKGTNHLSKTKCKIGCGNRKMRAAVRDDALTGRSRVVNEVELSDLLSLEQANDWFSGF